MLPLLLLLTIVNGPALTEGENYCHDPETWAKGQQILQSNLGDDEIYSIYAFSYQSKRLAGSRTFLRISWAAAKYLRLTA